MRYAIFYSALMFTLLFSVSVKAQVSVIPEPVNTIHRKGNFHIIPSTQLHIINGDDQTAAIAKRFAVEFKRASLLDLGINKASGISNGINITIDSNVVKNKEGYVLDITPEHINITAASPAGILYAFETLKKLLPPAFYKTAAQNRLKSWTVPAVYIGDHPEYAYRSVMLDVSRHFFTVQFLKKYLDLLASYKINTFHWHLTDSHGWRLEIKKYPRLTSVGAWRADRKGISMTIAKPTGKNEPATYGGYYTQEQVKDIVKYAAERNITVIPEIEMPGHCTAALVAYPQYTDLDNKTPLLIPCGLPGDLKHNFCVGYDSTYVFLENILKEVFQLFPSQYIHIGGDEVQGDPWLSCPRCQRLMKARGFTTAVQLQNYFTARIDSFIVANGRQAIGWEEMLAANVSPQSIGMVWHEKTNAIPLINNGRNVVLTPFRYTYLDFYQSDPRLEPYITYAPLYLDSVYAFNPRPPGVSDAAAAHILGGQACLWTENVETPARAGYMSFPRLFALSEDLWSPQSKKNYGNFINKVENEFKRLDAQHITYAGSMYNVSINPIYDKGIKADLSDQAAGKYTIHYTIDGSKPGMSSPIYHKQLNISKSLVLQTCLMKGNKILGKINRDTFTINKATGMPVSIITPKPDTGLTEVAGRLVDGIMGTNAPEDDRWVTISDSTCKIIIDLNKLNDIHSISLRCMEDQVNNMYNARSVSFSTSTDEKTFTRVYTVFNHKIPGSLSRHTISYNKTGIKAKARYIQIELQNAKINKDAKGNFMLLDEIIVK